MIEKRSLEPPRWLRAVVFLGQLYLFLVGVELLSKAIGHFGAGAAGGLFDQYAHVLANPFAGLSLGVLATILVQSSSVSTTMIVTLVAGGLPVGTATPMIMGANIGTTITNTLVSLFHVRRPEEFRRAFAGSTVHDFFNLLCVAVLLPLELLVGFLRHGAEWIYGTIAHLDVGGKFSSPVKSAVKWLAGGTEGTLEAVLPSAAIGWALLFAAFVLVYAALFTLTRNMKALMADNIEQWLNRVLRKRGLLGVLVGIGITVLVQSSSITTSLLVPMFAAGVLSLRAGFPIVVGANIGTTITALLAGMVTGGAGLIIALVHVLFNLAGTLLVFGVPRMRDIPVACAQWLADTGARRPSLAVVYVLLAFVALPILGIVIVELLGG